MSKWNDFCTTVGKYANRAVKKTEELADTASVHIKLKNLDVKLCEEYEKLGRLTYKSAKTDEITDPAEQIAKIDALRDEIQKLRDAIGSKN